MTEPILTIVAAGAAGAFMQSLAESGAKWLIEALSAQMPAALEKAHSNARNYMDRLAIRLEALERDVPAIKDWISNGAFEDPSLNTLFRKALVNAANTNLDERHEILAELIVQRLQSEEDDLVALAGGAACDVVCMLSKNHISWLAALNFIHYVRPITSANFKSDEEGIHFWRNFYIINLNILLSDLQVLSHPDIAHMAATNCLNLYPNLGEVDFDLASLLFSSKRLMGISNIPTGLFRNLLKEQEWYNLLSATWDNGLRLTTLTSVGMIIGVIYSDIRTGRTTKLQW